MQLCVIKQPGSLLTSVHASVGWPPSHPVWKDCRRPWGSSLTLAWEQEQSSRLPGKPCVWQRVQRCLVSLLEEFFLCAAEVAWPRAKEKIPRETEKRKLGNFASLAKGSLTAVLGGRFQVYSLCFEIHKNIALVPWDGSADRCTCAELANPCAVPRTHMEGETQPLHVSCPLCHTSTK